ncbi:type II toxin-antitoxin system RelE/ParE family toxin [Massilia sp. erpn]|uniref:type II toxin-antitoxin system RelE/ParE family toxin n=1 Tax=Massilia sp. erpn TaxID=2738142 RepID=UPI0021021E55|nr:type II toxin-antitoxin system RelE/ParE family toxin [Massilia sp. erpn]UTY57144.1 type II toxin-antitoxin system RelE/ParE family toxin [Massilia sp. erpn]
MNSPALRKIFKAAEYRRWESGLQGVAKAAIAARIKNLQHGIKGGCAPVGGGVSELRFHQSGPGWRVYFHETSAGLLILLLCGGDKSSQQADIRKARNVLARLKAERTKLRQQNIPTTKK